MPLPRSSQHKPKIKFCNRRNLITLTPSTSTLSPYFLPSPYGHACTTLQLRAKLELLHLLLFNFQGRIHEGREQSTKSFVAQNIRICYSSEQWAGERTQNPCFSQYIIVSLFLCLACHAMPVQVHFYFYYDQFVLSFTFNHCAMHHVALSRILFSSALPCLDFYKPFFHSGVAWRGMRRNVENRKMYFKAEKWVSVNIVLCFRHASIHVTLPKTLYITHYALRDSEWLAVCVSHKPSTPWIPFFIVITKNFSRILLSFFLWLSFPNSKQPTITIIIENPCRNNLLYFTAPEFLTKPKPIADLPCSACNQNVTNL